MINDENHEWRNINDLYLFRDDREDEEIKPIHCGCGGEAIVHDCDQYDSFAMLYWVSCEKCGITTETYDDKAEAIKAWNRAMGGRDLDKEVKEAYRRGYEEAEQQDEINRRWEESYRESQMPWNHYTEMGG